MNGMMMKMMKGKAIVASGDGGVVILAGDKLLKYDKNLVLKKGCALCQKTLFVEWK